jgi:hypothetical protein
VIGTNRYVRGAAVAYTQMFADSLSNR